MQNLLFETSDLGQIEAFLNETYAPMRIEGAGSESPRARIERRWLSEVSFDSLEFEFDLTYDASPLGRICLCRVQSGHIPAKCTGHATT